MPRSKQAKAAPRKPAQPDASAAIAASNAVLLRGRERRRCLGRGADHTFLSTGPDNRFCPECLRRRADLNLSARMCVPVTSGGVLESV
jgi:hypothetical protein